jgi:hypothetical protein
LLKLGFGRHHKQAFPAEICWARPIL